MTETDEQQPVSIIAGGAFTRPRVHEHDPFRRSAFVCAVNAGLAHCEQAPRYWCALDLHLIVDEPVVRATLDRVRPERILTSPVTGKHYEVGWEPGLQFLHPDLDIPCEIIDPDLNRLVDQQDAGLQTGKSLPSLVGWLLARQGVRRVQAWGLDWWPGKTRWADEAKTLRDLMIRYHATMVRWGPAGAEVIAQQTSACAISEQSVS